MLKLGFASCLVLVFLGGCSGKPVAVEDKEAVPTAVLAMKQRWQSRLSADGTVPEGALMRALEQREAMIGERAPGLQFSAWTWLGPANIGGRIRSILVHPTTPNTMYCGAVGGGVWKTLDGGANWFPLDGFMSAIGVCCMAMHPSDPNTLYAGTGEGFFESVEGSQNTAAIRGAGIFKSTDAGATWNQMASTNTPDWYFVNRLSFSPADPNIMLAATTSGIWRTTNGGSAWTKVWNGVAYDVNFHPTNGNLVIAGIHDDPGGIYSTNGGVTFLSSTGMTSVHRAEVQWAPSAPTTCYALMANTSQSARIYKSTNSGQTWVVQAGAGIQTYQAYNLALWVDPFNANSLVFGGVSLYRSTDGGATRVSALGGVHSDHHDIINHPQYNGTTNKRLYFAGDGGVGYTNDAAVGSGAHLNNGLGITQFYGAAFSPSGKIIGGAQDNYTNIYSGSINWTVMVIGGDGGFAAADPTDANYLYGSSQVHGIRRSTNGGSNFSSITTGLADAGTTARCNFIPHYILDPNNPNTMLACGLSLWRCSNVKAATPTWSAIKPPIPGGQSVDPKDDLSHMEIYDPRFHSTVTVAQGNSNIIWVGHNNGQIYKTSNGTAATPTWTQVDQNFPGGNIGRWIARIVIDPSNHNRVFVAFLGWEDDNIWMTTNGGTTWTQATGNGARRIPSVPVGALAMDPLRPQRLFAGTDIGLFISCDSGNSWGAVTDGPNTCPIDELTWKDNDELINVTHGRGLYLVDVTPTSTVTTPTGFVAGGSVRGGNLASLGATDDNRLSILGIFASPGPSSLEVVATTTAPYTNPLSLQVKVEAQASVGQNQVTDFYNFDTSTYEALDTRAATLSDSTATISASGNVSRFIHPTSREVRARVRFVSIPAMSKGKPEAKIDTIEWTFEK